MTLPYNLCLLEERSLLKNFKNIFGEYTSLRYQKWAKPHSQPVLSSACPCPRSTVTACAVPLRSCAKKPPSHSPWSSQSPSHCGPAAPCQPCSSCRTDFLLLLTPDSSSQKGAPAPGATPPRSSPSSRKMANNQGNAKPAPLPAVHTAGTASTEWIPASPAAC